VLGESRLREIADRVLRESAADQTEVLVRQNETNLTRFAANAIHQNVTETNASVRVRAIVGKQTGVASGNDLSEAGLSRVVALAEKAASFQKEDPALPSLPGAGAYSQTSSYCDATAATSPEERADGVGKILELTRANGLKAAGAHSTSASELLIANSLGVRAYHPETEADLMTVAMGETGSGYAQEISSDITSINPDRVAKTVVDKALRSANPTTIEPGEYTVILEEMAVADMIRILAYMGLGALAYQEKRSFMSGQLGERITGENIRLWDNGLDPSGFPMPFDFEGVPKQEVLLIEDGVARNVVYDTATAAREPGRSSTGHALPMPSDSGPMPTNLFVAPGTSSLEEMVESTERGIYVTRFHYTNPLHPVKTVFTGMTRDGTFLIENGKVTRPLVNLRFTQSILEALSRADLIGGTTKASRVYGFMSTCVPAMRIHGFRFTGATEL